MAIVVLQRGDLAFPRSLPDFQRLFPNEAACATYLERARWNNGFVCSRWGASGEPDRIATRPGVLRCRKCRCGIHHGVSPQHLQAYLNEFTFRFNRRFSPFNAFRSLFGIAGDVTAPT